MKISGLRDPEGKLVGVEPGLIAAYNKEDGTVTFLMARRRPPTIVPLTINGKEYSHETFRTTKDFVEMLRVNAQANGDLGIEAFERMPKTHFTCIFRAK